MEYSSIRLDESKYIEVVENYYVLKEEWAKKLPEERHLELCECIARRRKVLIFTGQSACAIYGIPRLDPYEMRPHCITYKGKHADIICWRERSLDPKAKVVNGFLVASPIRVICDLAKNDSMHSLLASINHCLNKKLFSKEELLAEIDKAPRIMGKNKIKKVLKVASDKCESTLESLAWITINNEGFLLPEQQIKIYDKKKFIGRVDMCWKIKGRTIILELDGMIKYEDRDAFRLEKIREGKLYDCGHHVVRATWDDVISGVLLKRLEKEGIPKRRNFKHHILKLK